MSAKRGLGTGLGALFGEEEQAKSEVELVPIARLEPREGQPRANFDEESLAELASSIAEYGLIQPITVRRLPSGYYQIIAGERRWRASRLAVKYSPYISPETSSTSALCFFRIWAYLFARSLYREISAAI